MKKRIISKEALEKYFGKSEETIRKEERKRIFEKLSHAVCYGINGDVTEEELNKVEKYLRLFANLGVSAQ